MLNKLFLLIGIFLSLNISAQKKTTKPKITVHEKGLTYVGLNAGISATGLFFEKDLDTDSIKYYGSSKPAIQLNADHFLSDNFSIGFFSSLQAFKVNIPYWQYGDSLNVRAVNDLNIKMKRIYIGGKLLYHYRNNEKVDVYSGLRGGILFWTKNIPTSEPGFTDEFATEFPTFNRPSFTIIPIGFRVKFSPQLSANIEFNATAPHLFAFGASYMFNNSKKP